MIAIVDYGVGNLASVKKALATVGADAELVRDTERLASADAIVLPGVGNFGHCAREFARYGFAAPLAAARERRTPILGVCVGMQLLFEGSDEDASARGLGFLRGRVVRMKGGVRVPQMGWNDLHLVGTHPWLSEIRDGDYFYFVHSYVPEPNGDTTIATVEYGGPRAAIVGADDLLGVQFHPEKSGANGLRLLTAFARRAEERASAAA
jgi:glutamine amidotransferase